MGRAMVGKSSPSAAKKRLAIFKLRAAEYLLTLVGPSLLKLAQDKNRWEEMRQLLLKVASGKKHRPRRKTKEAR
jgi:hypothetical protein